MFKHRLVWLPRDKVAFVANLDKLSQDGWELVCTVGTWQAIPWVIGSVDDSTQIQGVVRQRVMIDGDNQGAKP